MKNVRAAIIMACLALACGCSRNSNSGTDTTVLSSLYSVNLAPDAVAGPDRTVIPGENIVFDASASTDDKGIVSYTWDFDDSDGIAQADAEGITVTHAFDLPGNYTVTLTVTDAGGLFDRDTVHVAVQGDPDVTPPVAVVDGDGEIMEGGIAHFDASGSSDDRGIAVYRWDFDANDGFQAQLTGVHAAAEYPWPGTFTVTLEVEDTSGNKTRAQFNVTVLSDGAPDVFITQPLENMLVEGDVTVEGWAVDDGEISLIEVKVNDGPWMPATTTDGWMTWEFHTTVDPTYDAATGRYYRQLPMILARGTDTDNNTGRPLGINEYFANAVIEYVPAPDTFVNNPFYSQPEVILGEPYVGAVGSDPGEEVTLGGFGGYIVLRFYKPLGDDPDHPLGKDLIIYGNAFAANSDGTKTWKEPGYIEVMEDTNGNGLPDDKWYLIPGSHLNPPLTQVQRHYTVLDAGYPSTAIYPLYPREITLDAFQLPESVLYEPSSGYVDSNPVQPKGDGGSFNTPDDPNTPGIDEGSCGGDAVDIVVAVDPDTGEAAPITKVDFIRITNGLDVYDPIFGKRSPELKGAAHVRPPRPAQPAMP